VKWRIRLVKRKNPLLGYSSINCTSAPPVCRLSSRFWSFFPLQLQSGLKMSRVGRDPLTGFVSINVTPWMCCYSPSISPSLFVLVLCRRLCSNFPLVHTHVHTHTHTLLLSSSNVC